MASLLGLRASGKGQQDASQPSILLQSRVFCTMQCFAFSEAAKADGEQHAELQARYHFFRTQ